MPNWGLTAAQIASCPWGIDEALLAPAKTITDPVHGDIYLNRLEALIVDSPCMQRLRRVRQLGTTHLVYPAATHSRLSHALGTLRASQDLLDAVWNSHTNPQADHYPDNLMKEWAKDPRFLDEQFARATVLARLGALLHDLCHVPLGHTIEDDLDVLTSHDHNLPRFKRLWKQLHPDVRRAIPQGGDLYKELRILIISKDELAKSFKSEYPFVGDIVGNTICADLIDYLSRDHHNTGLPLALGDRFMDSFFVVASDHPYYAKRMVIGIERDGRLRSDIVSELVKYLRYRYELTERVLSHHAKTAADAMLGKALELWRDHLWIMCASEQHETVDFGDLDRASVEAITAVIDLEHLDGRAALPSRQITDQVREQIEYEFTHRSDDGLLEHLAVISETEPGSRRLAAVSKLSTRLLDRDLYKILGHAARVDDQAIADRVHERFGEDPQARIELERAAAKFAGLEHGYDVVVWLPDPGMRLKVADVLVHQSGSIAPLSKVEETSIEIVDQHRRLWAVTVYAPAGVKADAARSDAVLAYLGDRTGLTFLRPDGSAIPPLRTLIVDTVLQEFASPLPAREALEELLEVAASSDSESPTFDERVVGLREAGLENRVLPRTRRRAGSRRR